MEVEGGVTKIEVGNMEAEGGVTKAEVGNMEAEGGVTKAEAGNMEAEGGVTKADGGVMEVDLEEATEAQGGVTEPHLEEAVDREGGVMEAKEVAREMEYFEIQKKLKGPKFIYVEAKKDPTVIYSHLVRVVKIRMASMPPMGKQQDTARFSIDNEMQEQILAALLESKAPPFEKV
ncbi:hypothetical protein R1flu_021023 [Riccia fluitans]|uniref:Uncharacterized protein n=1 Tax=Riccia fluitans TaxID=41844 RepID=A0ABD1ZPP0_9MARC